MTTTIRLARASINGHSVFYRESGNPSSPTILLLPGYPSSSHLFRHLIPLLNDRYHLVAPDMPGFGFTTSPADFKYTFANIADVIEALIESIGLKKFAIYMFDYGAPVGLRIAYKNPSKVTAIISQNANAYDEGLTGAWDPIKAYWRDPTAENRSALTMLLQPDNVRQLFYQVGMSDPTQVEPESWTLDSALLARPGQTDLQLDLFRDYQSNVALYPAFHKYFRESQPPLLAIWGNRDPFFAPAGAEAYRKDLPKADVRFLETGHTALETHSKEIASAMKEFLSKNGL